MPENEMKMPKIKLVNIVKHFCTITRHRLLVCKHCFKIGLYWQGLTHDLSKYSPEEFWTGVRYYQGDRSPNAAEREAIGFSKAWLHHKGRNKHHFEYWIDFAPDKSWGLVGNKMPLRYLIEMVMDRIAASKVYKGKDYTDACAWEYFERGRDFVVMHPRTKYQLEYLLTMLKEQGEERTFAFIRALLARERAKEQAVRRKRMGHVIREIRERGRVL